jgi:hypothetical protein
VGVPRAVALPACPLSTRRIRELDADHVRQFGLGIAARLLVGVERLALDERDGEEHR